MRNGFERRVHQNYQCGNQKKETQQVEFPQKERKVNNNANVEGTARYFVFVRSEYKFNLREHIHQHKFPGEFVVKEVRSNTVFKLFPKIRVSFQRRIKIKF